MAANDRPVVRIVNGKPVVEPDPLRFPANQRNVVITWELDDPNFVFTADGIRIDGEDTPQGLRPQAEIVDGKLVPGGKRFIWMNKNSRPGRYKYTIRVQGPGGVRENDPSIVNGGAL